MLAVELQEGIYTPYILKMKNAEIWSIADGQFYMMQGDIAPYTPSPTIFRITSDTVDVIVNITVSSIMQSKIGVVESKKPKEFQVVQNSEVITVPIQLSQGINFLRFDNGEEEFLLIIRTSNIASLWEAWIRVMYSNSIRVNERLKQAAFSNFGTRLIEPFLSFQNLLPDLKSLQVLSTRLIARGLIHNVGEQVGLTDLISGLALTTPVYYNMGKKTYSIDPLDQWYNQGVSFGGREAHVWIPNVGINNWQAFLTFIGNQQDVYTPQLITDTNVIVDYQGDRLNLNFDLDSFGSDYLISLAKEECFASVSVSASTEIENEYDICVATYPFDLLIDGAHPIGSNRRSLDSGIPFDSGINFDSNKYDPFPTGWVGLSLSGRFEQDTYEYGGQTRGQHCLDTHVMPSSSYTGSLCCYKGFYSQTVVNLRNDFETIAPDFASAAFSQNALPWTIMSSEDGSYWEISVDIDGNLIAAPAPDDIEINYRILNDSSVEVGFDINSLGQIIVETPPSLSHSQTTTLYIVGEDGSVWDVDVSPTNQIYTTKIFPL